MLSFLSDRTCTERLKTNRFAKRGHTIQLRLGARLCRIHGRRMGNVLRMAFTQNRVRSCTGTSLSLTMRLLSHELSLPLRHNLCVLGIAPTYLLGLFTLTSSCTGRQSLRSASRGDFV